MGPNTFWSLVDSVAACPAGDTLIIGGHTDHPHPSRLRIEVWYDDANCVAKVGVPPESLWVTYQTIEGNLLVNDKGANVYADDSTDACGHTWITIPSFSGCGKVRLSLIVSGIFQGTKDVVVRTTDPNADGRADELDASPCDVNYDGQSNSADLALASPHLQHWHRQALHGVLVRRTSLRDVGPGNGDNSIGEGAVSWSPSGRYIAYSARDTCPTCPVGLNDPCRIKYVASDPARGNTVHKLTYNTTYAKPCPVGFVCDSMDYAPSWSPQGDVVYYVRRDRVIHRKGIPGVAADSSDICIIGNNSNKDDAQISPDGDSLAYTQVATNGFLHIFVANANGSSTRDLNAGSTNDWRYPQWSPDGSFLTVTRTVGGRQGLYKLRVRGSPNPTAYFAADTVDAAWSTLSPDSAIVVAGSARSFSEAHTTHVMDGTASSSTAQQAVENYPRHTFIVLFPRIAPDGTRLALLAKDPDVPGASLAQVWAARRNMNLPPQFVSATSSGEGARALADSTPAMDFAFSCDVPTLNTITVSALDPESDALTYFADFVPGFMNWDPQSRTLTYLANGICPAHVTYHVVFRATTASGGTDAFVAAIHFPGVLKPSGGTPSSAALANGSEPAVLADGPNPTRGSFSLATPLVSGATAELAVYDLSGRQVATVRGPSGSPITWNGAGSNGAPLPSGVYLYRLTVGGFRKLGRVALVQ